MYQMKLSRSAQHEPVRGYWCRVCETCYKSREGYNDHAGFERDLMSDFATARRKAVDKTYLEVSRLEKRLTKLTQILADPSIHQEQGVYSYLKSFSGAPTRKRLAEQSVVDWEEDGQVSKCPFCQQEFVNYSFRRHHCRLCGRVVCADLATACSSKIGLNVETCERNVSRPTMHGANAIQRQILLQKKATRYPSTYECVVSASIPSSARVILLENWHTSLQTRGRIRI